MPAIPGQENARLVRYPLWLTSGSPWRVRCAAIGIGALLAAAIAATDWLLFNSGVRPFGIMLSSDIVAGLLAFGIALHMMQEGRKRRESLLRRLEVIGEANHHIRNALELIQFSAQTTHDKQVIEQISTAVDRIQWVLRELLGEESPLGDETVSLQKPVAPLRPESR